MSAGGVSVSGTFGNVEKVYCDIAVTERRVYLMFNYPSKIMKIEKIEVMALKGEERNLGIIPEEKLSEVVRV